MKFETEYKNLNFKISLELIAVEDLSLYFNDKFHRISNQTIADLKKGTVAPYNLIVISTRDQESRTHYWSNIMLPTDYNDLVEELGQFLDDEEILDSITENWELLDKNQY